MFVRSLQRVRAHLRQRSYATVTWLRAGVRRLVLPSNESALVAAALARAEARIAKLEGDIPDDEHQQLTSRVCGSADFRRASFTHWCAALDEPPRLHRKLWELWFIARALEERGLLTSGRTGIGFGVGTEPLPAAFAARGVAVIATDQGAAAIAEGWATTGQWADGLAALQRDAVCDPALFRQSVTLRRVDMNSLPSDLPPADFVWSACALEHLGSIENGLRFIEASLGALKPGGIAVHTTELNLSSNDATLDHEGTVLFRRRDIDALAPRVASLGARMLPVTTPATAGIADDFVDVPPYRSEPHLRLRLRSFVTTSIGIVVEKGNA